MKKQNKQQEDFFPLCKKLKIPISTLKKANFSYCPSKKLDKRLKELCILEIFNQFFGIQTQYFKGPFTNDVESVLVRIYKNKKIGSQLFWD